MTRPWTSRSAGQRQRACQSLLESRSDVDPSPGVLHSRLPESTKDLPITSLSSSGDESQLDGADADLLDKQIAALEHDQELKSADEKQSQSKISSDGFVNSFSMALAPKDNHESILWSNIVESEAENAHSLGTPFSAVVRCVAAFCNANADVIASADH